MLHEVGSPTEMTADELYAAYRAAIREAVETVGTDAAAAETGLAPERLDALVDEDDPGSSLDPGTGAAEASELTLEEAGSLLALTADETGEEVVALARDDLLLAMSNAVLDVDALASHLDVDLEPREIQSKVEGRFPMTLREFARIRAEIGAKERV